MKSEPEQRFRVRARDTPLLLVSILTLVIGEAFILFGFARAPTLTLIEFVLIGFAGVGIGTLFLATLGVPSRVDLTPETIVVTYRSRSLELRLTQLAHPPLKVGPFGALLTFKLSSGGMETCWVSREVGLAVERLSPERLWGNVTS